MSDVFISYSSKDEDFAIMLYKTLKTKNVKPWIALFDIPYGQNYAKEIFNAIENVKIFSVIISSNSNESDSVKNEIELATQQIKNGMMIMPIRIDKKEIDEELQYYLARKQWLDASIPPIQEKINSYCEHIRNMLNTNTVNEHEVSSESRHLKDNIQSDNFIKKEIHDTYKKYALAGDFSHAIKLLEEELTKKEEREDINSYDEEDEKTSQKTIAKASMKLFSPKRKGEIKDESNECEKHNLIGFYYNRVNDYEKALQHFKKALSIAPEHAEPSIHENIASTYMYLEDYENAIKEYTESLSLQRLEFGQWNTKTLFARSVAFYKAGKYEESLKDYQQAMSRD